MTNEQKARKWAEEKFQYHWPAETAPELKHTMQESYLAGMEEANRWVSVDERLPDKRGYYFAGSVNKKAAFISYYDADDKSFYDSGITHWLPLPQPPNQ